LTGSGGITGVAPGYLKPEKPTEGKKMADKQLVFSDQEMMQIEAILIDKDKEEALRYLAKLVEWMKGHAGRACGTGPIK
jgi:hypothetical protein